MMIARVIVGSGNARRAVQLMPGKAERREAANQIKRFLFPSDGAYHKAKRRGDRALAGAVA